MPSLSYYVHHTVIFFHAKFNIIISVKLCSSLCHLFHAVPKNAMFTMLPSVLFSVHHTAIFLRCIHHAAIFVKPCSSLSHLFHAVPKATMFTMQPSDDSLYFHKKHKRMQIHYMRTMYHKALRDSEITRLLMPGYSTVGLVHFHRTHNAV